MSLYILIGLFFFLGAVFGWVAFFRTQKLSVEIFKLKKELSLLKTAQAIPSIENTKKEVSPQLEVKASISSPSSVSVTSSPQSSKKKPEPPKAKKTQEIHLNDAWISSLKDNWMIWLGGACVGLSGIFLVKYSADQGLLGPGARISAGIIIGLLLHVGSEWLRRNKEAHASFAALAAGGSITLFASLLASLHLYQMLNPTLVFILLALVAMSSMGLALLHGPVLAAIGILGAYLVPLMVGGDAKGGALTVLIYTLIISASALVLLRYIYRNWLWVGVFAGVLAWWFLTLDVSDVDNYRGIYLSVFAYFLLSIPQGDWLLQKIGRDPGRISNFKEFYKIENSVESVLPFGLALIILFQFFSMVMLGFESSAILNWSPLVILMLIVGGKQKALSYHPWLLLISQLLAWLMAQFDGSSLLPLSPNILTGFYWYCLLSTILYSAFSIFNYKRNDNKTLWVSLAILTPLLFLALAYILSDNRVPSLQWGLLAALLAGIYLSFATILMRKNTTGFVPAWFFIGSHLGYSLAVAMFFREASMTLALAVQIISLAWLIKRFAYEKLSWLLKIVVAVVLLRLSLNPWLEAYPVGVHWSLWTYGGATLCCFIGGLQLKQQPELRQWAFAATLHLLALTIWSETRYWLYDGNVYAREYDLIEATLNLSIFASLGIIYYLKQKVSSNLEKIYAIYSKVLLTFALLNYAIILLATISSAYWVWGNIGEAKIMNLMLLTFGMPIVLGYLCYRYYVPRFSKLAALFTGSAFFIFISLQIRHFWNGDINLTSIYSDGELYTYSAIWLVMAVSSILGGVWRFGEGCYRAGMLLLALVIAKLFLIDMAGLEGLLRVTSFMGMGLCLLGIAYLHQKLIGQEADTEVNVAK